MNNKTDPRSGERLRQIREHRRVSQGKIAKAIGVSAGTIQNYERGRVAITTDRLQQLARALQCEPAELLASPAAPLPRYRFRQRSLRISNEYDRRQMMLPLMHDDEE